MRLLLDTHIFIWFVSAWEMSIKSGLGKMSLTEPIEPFFEDQAQRNRFEILPITLPPIAAVERLPHHHRDPFDRLLIAQSMIEAMPLISIDRAFDPYPVSLLW